MLSATLTGKAPGIVRRCECVLLSSPAPLSTHGKHGKSRQKCASRSWNRENIAVNSWHVPRKGSWMDALALRGMYPVRGKKYAYFMDSSCTAGDTLTINDNVFFTKTHVTYPSDETAKNVVCALRYRRKYICLKAPTSKGGEEPHLSTMRHDTSRTHFSHYM